jgi:hypothetical protein
MSRLKIKTLCALIIAFSTLTTNAQRIRYKDLAPALDTVSHDQQMSMLREYLAEDQNHPNANYRLAILHYQIFRHADPLLEYRKAMAHAREATLRLLRAKLMVTAQEVRSNNEYYATFFKTLDSKGKPFVDFPVVLDQINVASDSVARFQEKMPSIFQSFTKSVRLYDKAVKLFAKINTDYKSLEDIYMFFDPAMEIQLSKLKESYDSSLYHFKNYQSLIAAYPLASYNQKFHVKPIKVYRMDGLITRMNFLSTDVEFWNYAAWVDEIRKKHSEEIVGIREKIEKHETDFSQNIKLLEASTPVSSIPHLAKDLTFQLNNYDKNSLALAILEYKASKQNWLDKLQNVSRDTALDSKLDLYSQLIQHNRLSDTLLTHVKGVMTPPNVKKHNNYVNKFYGGDNGLKVFVQKEESWIAKTFSDYQETLKQNLLTVTSAADQPGKSVRIGSFTVPLFSEKKPVDLMLPSTIVTTKISHNPDGSMYLAGVHKMNKKTNFNSIGFVARVNPDGKGAWLKELNFSPDSIPVLDGTNYIGDMVATQEGCAVLVTSLRADRQAVVNNFVFVSEKGEIKSIRVRNTGIARRLIYQEKGNSFIMVFKGTKEAEDFAAPEEIALTSINILGDPLWHQELNVAGTLTDITTVRDGYIVSGNYNIIRDERGQEIRTRVSEGQSNPFLAKLGMKGEIIKIHPVTSSESVYIQKVVKVNDGSINLLGYVSSFQNAQNGANGKLLHMMTTYELKSVCSNF